MSKLSEKPKRTRAEQKVDTREKIRAAAWKLFTTVGYDATTTKAVAEEAGVASGTVFVHARDKADLLFLVLHDKLRATVDAQFANMQQGPLVAQWMHVFRALFRMYEPHLSVATEFVRQVPGADKGPNGKRVDEMTFGFLARMALLVEEAQLRGEVDAEVPPLLAARNAFALYFLALMGWVNGYVPHGVAIGELELSLHLAMNGLAKR